MLPTYFDSGSILKWQLQENVPGKFPFTAGVFELKREGEDPTRMFAGEGCPERTNRRFHYVSVDQPAIRLSTAFDSVTLYGEDPATRPDIFGKIGVLYSTVFLTIAVIIFGEILPKTIAIQSPEKCALIFCRVIEFLYKIFAPIVAIIQKIIDFSIGIFQSKKIAKKQNRY
jgi:methylmalonyl-CoA mutase N-terminal domain/subunit